MSPSFIFRKKPGAVAKPFSVQSIPKMAMAMRIPSRHLTTEKATPTEGNEILARQRLNRPVSPHLGIYKLNQTWLGHSAWTRITGCTLSGAAYAYFAAYLVSPLLGWHLESASVAAAFSALPVVVAGGIKLALSFPFTYHFINGVRHLIFDIGKGFTKKEIVRGEIALWSLSLVGSLFLAFGL
ncbi:succinate dehydrogenase (ubiquinone) cytochrome b560 subunit [Geosmithia morbida]|uniref:Succinate dehydrogenase (Ubiquinone) cytochrome b560 subunit n=1 Tax=Geosmithia morbida TaxID=1094350 RepID=A0A9P5D1N8_9HYPO|nr:succinate dehydrogenase (ubiquinone) cytochrome b560 subunit [Geosmithia morbida]KAF4120661.1 succinate dehydrogenase (ubiquinone) cytochrome b560 subunit [Geosmithia morbida]